MGDYDAVVGATVGLMGVAVTADVASKLIGKHSLNVKPMKHDLHKNHKFKFK